MVDSPRLPQLTPRHRPVPPSQAARGTAPASYFLGDAVATSGGVVPRSAVIATPRSSRPQFQPRPLQQPDKISAGGGDYVGTGLDGVKRQVAAELRRLQRESEGLDPCDKAVLELHRESFTRLIGSFKVYAPVLAQIKSAFDTTLDSRMQQIFHSEPKVVKLDALKNGYDLNLQAIYDKHDADAKPYRDDLENLRKTNQMLDEKIAEKRKVIDADTASLKDMKFKLDELEEWQQTLVESMKQWEVQLERMNTAADQSDKSVWRKKQGIAKAKDKILMGQGTLARKQTAIKEKDWAIKVAVEEIIDLHTRIQSQTAAVRLSSSKLEQMVAKLDETKNSLEKQKATAVNRDRAVTPRPDWEEASAFLQEKRVHIGGQQATLNLENPSAQIASDLAKMLETIKIDLMEARQDVRQHESQLLNEDEDAAARMAERERAEMQGSGVKYLVCQGKGPNVPVYLRATGKVENKNYPRPKVVAFLKEFWKTKGETAKTRAVKMDIFLDNFFRRKFPGKNLVESVYNIMYGVSKFSFDADCDLFAQILNGSLPEGAYYGQVKMIDGLQTLLKKSDKENHGGRVWNTLERQEFSECLTKYFPLKTQDDLKALRRALSRDQPLPDIRYMQLFEEDESGLPPTFLEALRDQYASDIEQSYPKLEDAIRKMTLEEAEKKQRVTRVEKNECYVGSELYQLLVNVPLIKNSSLCKENADPARMLSLMEELELLEYHEGDVIVQEGSVAAHAFIVQEGGACVVKEGVSNLNTNYSFGDFFGELALTHEDVRAASVLAKASRRGICRCVRISKKVFDQFSIDEADNQELLHKRQMQYFMTTKLASQGIKDEKGKKGTLEGMITTVKTVRDAMPKYFDNAIPKSEIDRVLNVGRGRPEDDAEPYDDDELISIANFMSNVRSIVIERFSPNEQLSDAQKRAEFLRNVSDSEREAIQQCFNELDESGDGCLDLEELGMLMRRIYGFDPTSKQLNQLMIEIDTDGNGVIDIDEFISAMATVKEVKVAGEIFKWRQCFDKYDVDGSGELSADELLGLVGELWNEKFPNKNSGENKQGRHMQMIQFMVDEADVDGSGEINWWEFCHMMQKIMDEESRELEAKRQTMIIETRAAESETLRKGAGLLQKQARAGGAFAALAKGGAKDGNVGDMAVGLALGGTGKLGNATPERASAMAAIHNANTAQEAELKQATQLLRAGKGAMSAAV